MTESHSNLAKLNTSQSCVPVFLPTATFITMCRIDRTFKMYIGGAQKRPDATYCRPIVNPDGQVIGQVSEGNRKDIREAVEAAHKAAPGYETIQV